MSLWERTSAACDSEGGQGRCAMPENPRSYLYSMVRNRCIDHIRSRRTISGVGIPLSVIRETEMSAGDDGLAQQRDGAASLDLFLNHEPDYYFTFQGVRVECRTEYRLLLFKLSPEAYYAAKACYIYMHNSYGDIGLSSPAFIYSNVIGGIGYFGAMHQSESDWIANPGEMVENQPYIQ